MCKIRYAVGYSLVFCQLSMSVANAQSDENSIQAKQKDVPGFEKIEVTARKVAESIQEVPLTITAFSSEEITRGGFQNLEDISLHTPGLTFNTNLGTLYPGREGASIRFRGIGDAEGAEITKLQPTSVFIDGVFVLNGAQSIGLVDLERIEVVKGPQAALFGRNSFAGAINYITRNPDLENVRGKIVAEVASFEQHDLYASIEGPLIEDKLSALLSVRSYSKGEMFTASDSGPLGQESTYSISSVLFTQPSDNFHAKLRIFYQQDEDGPAASAFIPGRLVDSCSGTSREGLDDNGNTVTLMPTRFICGSVPERSELGFDPIDSNTSLRPQTFLNNTPNFLIDNLLNSDRIGDVPELDGFGLKRDIFRVSLNMGYDFEDDSRLTLLASYNDNQAAVLRDLDLTPTESWYQYNAQSGEDKSIDIQYSSSFSKNVSWLVGANHYKQTFLTSASGGSYVAACLAGFCDAGPLLLPLENDGGDDVSVYGLYGSLSYDLTELFNIGLEGRYQSDKRSDGISDIKQEFKKFLPRVTLSYQAFENVNLYANWSQGYLPGLVNGVVLGCNNAPFSQPFISPITGESSTASECDQMREQLGASFQSFTESQTLDAWELGFKSDLLNKRLRMNFALYFYDWSNQPSTNFVTVFRDDNFDGIPNDTINAVQVATSGSSKSSGVELEASYFITDNWTINSAVSYNHNEYKNYLGLSTFNRANGGSRNFSGNRAPRFPKWSGSISSTYFRELNQDWEWFLRGDLSYQGETFTGSENLAVIDSFILANLRFGFEKEDLRIELFMENVFDEDGWRGGLSYFDVSDIQGTFDFNNLGVSAIAQSRRSVGLRLEVGF